MSRFVRRNFLGTIPSWTSTSYPSRRRAFTLPSSSCYFPQLQVTRLPTSPDSNHISDVSRNLELHGILKITLDFKDQESQYLEQLILSLNQHHKHGLPITHSSSRGWFWDVRPTDTATESHSRQARSETMESFPWHTDCSYESLPPRFFALQVIQPDRCGGGTLSVLAASEIFKLLSPSIQKQLAQPEFEITVPEEFCKGGDRKVIGSIANKKSTQQSIELRYRNDIIKPLTEKASEALRELQMALVSVRIQSQVVHLTPELLPAGSIVLIDNRRWLHARNEVRDPERHLRRVRWDAKPF